MSTLLHALTRFLAPSCTAQQRDHAFLAESSDLRDFEHRVRLVETGRHDLYAVGSYGILMR